MKPSSMLAALFAFGIITPGSGAARTPAPETESEAGPQIAGPVLMVTDLERSIRFYTQGLGLQVASRLPGKPGPGAVLTAPGAERTPFILLRQQGTVVRATPPIALGDGLSRIMIRVADAKRAADRLSAAGYAVPDLANRRIFFVTDPDGYRYEIMQVSAGK